jgi:thiol-disulfide isomerase/thioredoxin
MEIGPKNVRAPEIYGDFWFNSEPVAISALRGQVILIDFWDYTCVNCIRTIPYLVEWHKRYQEKGLVIVGVHTPEFPFARNPERVEEAIKRLGITYPVVTDNEYLIWSSFANRAWPAKYLIDRDGYIRYYHYGEGNYATTERTIQALLVDAGYRGELPLLMEALREADRLGAVCYRATPKIYTGYARGMLGNVEGLNLDSTIDYVDPRIYVDGRFYAHGRWFVDRDYLRYQGGPDSEGYLVLPYQALEVNAVLKPEDGKNVKVFVMQDDADLSEEIKGEDISFEEEGRSFVTVEGGRMYNLVRNRQFGAHTLKLVTSSNSFSIYSFTFVSCVVPELVLTARG